MSFCSGGARMAPFATSQIQQCQLVPTPMRMHGGDKGFGLRIAAVAVELVVVGVVKPRLEPGRWGLGRFHFSAPR